MSDTDPWVTPAMIEAGVFRLRELHLGDPEASIVEAIYHAMYAEMLAKVPAEAPSWSVKVWWKHNPAWPVTSAHADEGTARLVAAHWAKRSGVMKVEIIAP